MSFENANYIISSYSMKKQSVLLNNDYVSRKEVTTISFRVKIIAELL